jgi:hypothetical protein
MIFLLLSGLVLFALSMAVRAKTGGKYEIKTIDLVIVLVPLFLWLIGTGKIQKVAIGGVEFETAQAFIGASEKPIDAQVARTTPVTIDDVVNTVERATKGGIDRIPKRSENKTEALEFRLGHGGYWGPAIQKYFESLSAHSFLRYAIIYYQDGSFFGVYNARDLLDYFRLKGALAYHSFAQYLNRADTSSLNSLKDLPGFTPGEYAVISVSNKRFVLQEMEKRNKEVLPVVDSKKRFIGVVERNRLTTSLIIDVATELEKIE